MEGNLFLFKTRKRMGSRIGYSLPDRDMERAYAIINLNHQQIENICRGYFGDDGHLEAYEHLSGGAVNTTYKIVWKDIKYVLRFYARDPQLAQVEKEIYRLIHERVPVAELLYINTSKEPYPFALFSFVDKKHIFEI